MKIILDGTPIAWQRAGIHRGRYYDRQREVKDVVQSIFHEQYHDLPMDVPIILSATFSYELPKSWSLIKRKTHLKGCKDSRPDLDNLLKFILDCGNSLLWTDDSKIVKFRSVAKIWDTRSRTEIEFEELSNGSTDRAEQIRMSSL